MQALHLQGGRSFPEGHVCDGVLNNWMAVTHGALGIAGIPEPVIMGWVVPTENTVLLDSTALTLLARRLALAAVI